MNLAVLVLHQPHASSARAVVDLVLLRWVRVVVFFALERASFDGWVDDLVHALVLDAVLVIVFNLTAGDGRSPLVSFVSKGALERALGCIVSAVMVNLVSIGVDWRLGTTAYLSVSGCHRVVDLALVSFVLFNQLVEVLVLVVVLLFRSEHFGLALVFQFILQVQVMSVIILRLIIIVTTHAS